MSLVWCETCYQQKGAGAFDSIAAHDAAATPPEGAKADEHPLLDLDLATIQKARWVALCPACGAPAVNLSLLTEKLLCGVQETTPLETLEPIAVANDGTEVLACEACGVRYQFNLDWTFATKALPEAGGTVFVVREYDSVHGAFRHREEAEALAARIERETLQACGWTQGPDGRWRSPDGPDPMTRGQALNAISGNGWEPPEIEEVPLHG